MSSKSNDSSGGELMDKLEKTFSDVVPVVTQLVKTYKADTPRQIKVIDVFLLYILATGLIQFAYRMLVGPFPYNAFLSGFISAVGCFVLTVSLRMQVANRKEFSSVSPYRAYADYVVSNLILHFVVWTFMG